MNLVLVGSHLGYPMDRTPLGGGAMVGIQLVRHWARSMEGRLTVLGSGSHPPAPGTPYIQVPQPDSGGKDPDLVHLSELEYARFCRKFEREATQYLICNQSRLDPRRTVVAVNDISESPDLACLSKLGYRVLSLWHVDVVEFFNRIYLREFLQPERLTQAFSWMDKSGMTWLVPEVLKLVFQKQHNAVHFSDRLIVPSRQMAETLQRCYAYLPANGKGPLEKRILVTPWGGWPEELSEADVQAEAAHLKKHYQIHAHTRVLMTLSRISPEKGIHLLLKALELLETFPEFAKTDLCVFVCGEPAFMRGESYDRAVRRAADKLKRFRVFFPGYLSAFDKQAYFRLAQLFVSPSIHESYGLTLVEALRAGLPVLASDHYGVEEILKPEFGRIVAYTTRKQAPQLLAQGLAGMLKDRKALVSMGVKAREAAAFMTFADTAQSLLETICGLVK